MILVDSTLLLYAEHAGSDQHLAARKWWDGTLFGTEPVCLCWQVMNAFIRIGTSRRVFTNPLSLQEATDRITSWFGQPCVRLVSPTQRHWEVFQQMLHGGKATGNLVSDAHLAAIAVENGCTLFSTDADFSRFPKLKWRNPLKAKGHGGG